MKKTQFGWVFIIVVPVISALVWYYNPDKSAMWPMWAIAATVLLLFFKLTVLVDDAYVRFSFGVGLIRGKFALTDIVNCRPVSYVAMGWGIRIRPGAILYNVSGNKAIELTLRGRDRKVWLGTNVPERLAEYINKHIVQAE